MNQQRLSGPRPGLIPRFVAGVTGVLVLIGAFLVGIVAWIILAGIVMIGAVALSIWFWRQRRRFEKYRREASDGVIEAEFEVLNETRDREP